MTEPYALTLETLLDIDDELGLVVAELRAVMLALDSRGLEVDPGQVSGLISIVDRQVDRITDVRTLIRPRPEDGDDEGDESADESGEG